MKGWIIGLAIVFAVLKLAQIGVANYIRNTREEAVKYYLLQGSTTLGFIHGICGILCALILAAEAILILVYYL